MKKRIRNFRVYAEMECSAFILTPQAVRALRSRIVRLAAVRYDPASSQTQA